MRIGELVKFWRSAKGLSLRKFSEQLGISPQTLMRLEGGEDVDGLTLAKIIVWQLEPSDKKNGHGEGKETALNGK